MVISEIDFPHKFSALLPSFNLALLLSGFVLVRNRNQIMVFVIARNRNVVNGGNHHFFV